MFTSSIIFVALCASSLLAAPLPGEINVAMRDAVEAALRSAPKESGELPYRLSPSQYKILHDGAKPHGVIGGTQAQKDAKNAIDQIKAAQVNAIKNKKAAPQQAADAVAQIKAYNEQLPGHQVAKVVAHGVGYAGAAGLGALAATEVIKHHHEQEGNNDNNDNDSNYNVATPNLASLSAASTDSTASAASTSASASAPASADPASQGDEDDSAASVSAAVMAPNSPTALAVAKRSLRDLD